MSDVHQSVAAAIFDSSIAARAPDLECRAERASDAAFLADLFIQSSPLSDFLPHSMLVQQAEMAEHYYREHSPNAMRRIFLREGQPVSRLIIDWSTHLPSHCVDVAVSKAFAGKGLGSAILQAWLDTAATLGSVCRLEVQASNPALRLYVRLGFSIVPNDEAQSPIVFLEHTPPRAATG